MHLLYVPQLFRAAGVNPCVIPTQKAPMQTARIKSHHSCDPPSTDLPPGWAHACTRTGLKAHAYLLVHSKRVTPFGLQLVPESWCRQRGCSAHEHARTRCCEPSS